MWFVWEVERDEFSLRRHMNWKHKIPVSFKCIQFDEWDFQLKIRYEKTFHNNAQIGEVNIISMLRLWLLIYLMFNANRTGYESSWQSQ